MTCLTLVVYILLQCGSAAEVHAYVLRQNEEVGDIKHGLITALDDLVSQNMIRNEIPGYRGLRGTYRLLPTAIKEAGEALGLSAANIKMLEGVAPKKLKIRWFAVCMLALSRNWVAVCSVVVRKKFRISVKFRDWSTGMLSRCRQSETKGDSEAVDSRNFFYLFSGVYWKFNLVN